MPGFPEPVEFDQVHPQDFCIHDTLWQGIPPISSTMLHEETLYLHFYLSLTNFILGPLVLVLEETLRVQSLSAPLEAL